MLSIRVGGRARARCVPRVSRTTKLAKRCSTAPMPYRPGYGLGSFIEPSVIAGMRKEAKVRSRIVVLEQIDRDLEQTAMGVGNEKDRYEAKARDDGAKEEKIEEGGKKYQAQIDTLQGLRNPIQDDRLKAFEELGKVMNDVAGVLGNGTTTGDDGGTGTETSERPATFTTFNSGVESPVNWTASPIVYKDRAYDSISVDASLHAKEETKQSMRDWTSGVAKKTALKASKPFAGDIFTSMSNSMNKATNKSKDEHNARYTLVLSAFATHRRVQQFDVLSLDANKLIKAWNYYHPKDSIDKMAIKDNLSTLLKPKTETDGNDNVKTDEKQISLLTECFLGSGMVGMVDFIRRQSTDSSQRAVTNESQKKLEANFSCWLASITGSTQISTNTAARIADLLSQDQVDVQFSLQCLGYMPKLHASQLELAVEKFANFDPANFTKESMQVVGTMPNVAESGDNKSLTARQSNMAAVIEATVMSLTKAESMIKTSVLDLNTFMNAFDEYSENAPKTDGVGIPVGMNVKSFTKWDVEFEYAKQFLGLDENQAKEKESKNEPAPDPEKKNKPADEPPKTET